MRELKMLKPPYLLQQFNPVPKRIMNVRAPHSGNILGLIDANPCVAQSLNYRFVIRATERRVCLFCGTKLGFNAQMNLYAAALKPASAAFGKLSWLRDFFHPKQVLIESSHLLFFAGWHCELHMINADEWCSGFFRR